VCVEEGKASCAGTCTCTGGHTEAPAADSARASPLPLLASGGSSSPASEERFLFRATASTSTFGCVVPAATVPSPASFSPPRSPADAAPASAGAGAGADDAAACPAAVRGRCRSKNTTRRRRCSLRRFNSCTVPASASTRAHNISRGIVGVGAAAAAAVPLLLLLLLLLVTAGAVEGATAVAAPVDIATRPRTGGRPPGGLGVS